MIRDYFLRTDRVGFSTWSLESIKLAELLWGNEDVTRLICASGKFTKEDIVQRLNQEIKNEERYGIQYWPIFDLATDTFIGCCGLRPHKPGEFELGFHLRPEYWGQGYAVEAANAVIQHAFTVLKADMLFAGHNPNNTNSKKVLKKLGFIYIGDEYYEPTKLYHPSYKLRKPSYNI